MNIHFAFAHGRYFTLNIHFIFTHCMNVHLTLRTPCNLAHSMNIHFIFVRWAAQYFVGLPTHPAIDRIISIHHPPENSNDDDNEEEDDTLWLVCEGNLHESMRRARPKSYVSFFCLLSSLLLLFCCFVFVFSSSYSSFFFSAFSSFFYLSFFFFSFISLLFFCSSLNFFS